MIIVLNIFSTFWWIFLILDIKVHIKIKLCLRDHPKTSWPGGGGSPEIFFANSLALNNSLSLRIDKEKKRSRGFWMIPTCRWILQKNHFFGSRFFKFHRHVMLFSCKKRAKKGYLLWFSSKKISEKMKKKRKICQISPTFDTIWT